MVCNYDLFVHNLTHIPTVLLSTTVRRSFENCWYIELSEYRTVGISTCRKIDLT